MHITCGKKNGARLHSREASHCLVQDRCGALKETIDAN